MDPVEEFVRLKDAIRCLEDRAQVLRAGFLSPARGCGRTAMKSW